MEADSAPAHQTQPAPRLHQPQRDPSHPGVPAALLSRQPVDKRAPCGHCGDVTQAGISSFSRSSHPWHDGLSLSADSRQLGCLKQHRTLCLEI